MISGMWRTSRPEACRAPHDSGGAAFVLVQPETAPGEAAGLLAAAQQVLGITPNLAKALANGPAALRAYLGFRIALRGGSLPLAVRERIALLVAQEQGCDYGLSMHTYTGTKLAGLSVAEAALARRGTASEPRPAAILSFARAVARADGSVTDDDLAAARTAGLSDGDLTEVIAHVALGVFTAYVAKAARLDIDWPLVCHND